MQSGIKTTVIKHIKYLSAIILYLIVSLIFDIGCPIRKFIHMPCPACGMTRAWYHILKFDILTAFEYHPLFLFVPAYVLLLIHYDKWSVGQRYKKLKNFFAFAGAAVIIVVYIYRIINGFGNV